MKIKKILKILNENQAVIIPTETVYGIFALPTQKNIKMINEIKERNKKTPITIMFESRKKAYESCELSEYEKSILDSEWPGTKTFILKASPKYKKLLKSDTIGIRVPEHSKIPKLNELLLSVGPLLSTSVNKTGEQPINNYRIISKKYPKIKVIKGQIKSPEPSTIISLLNGNVEIVREGK